MRTLLEVLGCEPNQNLEGGNELTERLKPIPPELLEFYSRRDKWEGWVHGGYLAIWSLEQCSAWNKLEIGEGDRSKMLRFASNGGGEEYAFKSVDGEYIYFARPQLGDESDALRIGPFENFVRFLEAGSKIEHLLES